MLGLDVNEIRINKERPFINEGVTITCDAAGFPRPHITFLRDNVTIKDGIEDTLILRNVSINDTGSYSCSATNDYGKNSTNATMLRVLCK